MYGAILGDIIGSPYEFNRGDKTKDFPLFSERSRFTDDTVMTIAVADAFLDAQPNAADEWTTNRLINGLRMWGKKYPRAGYGVRFMINPFGITCRLPKGILQIVMEARQPSDDDYKRENHLLEKAIHFATAKHAGQLRKGTTTPYIVHPLETMNILRSMNADTNLLIAGLLHDTVEDTDTTVEEIAEVFGTDVADLVGGHSEDTVTVSTSSPTIKRAAVSGSVGTGTGAGELLLAITTS